MVWPSNTKVVDAKPKCSFCDGTGNRKEQIFNWMRDDQPEKYIIKPRKKKARKRKL